MIDCRQSARHRQSQPGASAGGRSSGRKSPALAAVASLLLLAAPGEAGTIGGAMGNVSRATIGISVSVAPRVELLRAGPESASTKAGESGVRAAQPLCIWGNTALGTYNVTASSEAAGGFLVRDGNGHGLAYSVEWETLAGRAAPVALSNGAALNGLTAATSVRCGGGATAGLVVKVPEAVGRSAAGGYAGSLLLLVAPD
jgi:hypothetical protein